MKGRGLVRRRRREAVRARAELQALTKELERETKEGNEWLYSYYGRLYKETVVAVWWGTAVFFVASVIFYTYRQWLR